MVKRFVFVRHGDYDKTGLSPSERKNTPLTELGAQQALEVGSWLQTQNIKLDEVITTETERTRETADWLLMTLDQDGQPVKSVTGGFSLGKTGLDEKLYNWKCVGPTVCLVGHCKQQEYCISLLGGPKLTNGQRAVLVYERDSKGHWIYSTGKTF